MDTPLTDERQLDEFRARVSTLALRFPGSNPLLNWWRRVRAIYDLGLASGPSDDPMSMLGEAALTRRYAYGVPDDNQLSILAEHAPIIEMGAGTGYWSHLSREWYVEHLAFDFRPPLAHKEDRRDGNGYRIDPNGFADEVEYTAVNYGEPRHLIAYQRTHTLFLCWPPMSSMSFDCLNSYFAGKTIIFVGEFDLIIPGCTANLKFCQRLNHEFDKVSEVEVPNWPERKSTLTVWKRNRLAKPCK